MRTTSNPLFVVGALGALVALPLSAQEVPVLVSGEWLEERLEAVVVLFVGMLHDGTPPAFIPGAALLDYHGITATIDGLRTGHVYEVTCGKIAGDGAEIWPATGHYSLHRMPRERP